MKKFESVLPQLKVKKIYIETNFLDSGIYHIQFIKNKKPIKEITIKIS
jgi:hypothetical protein